MTLIVWNADHNSQTPWSPGRHGYRSGWLLACTNENRSWVYSSSELELRVWLAANHERPVTLYKLTGNNAYTKQPLKGWDYRCGNH